MWCAHAACLDHGSIFEELIGRFNKENRERFTPHDIVDVVPSFPPMRSKTAGKADEAAPPVIGKIHKRRVEAFLRRDMLPHTGYEISFTPQLYRGQLLRTPDGVRADIMALEKETERFFSDIVEGAGR
jgi:hypothetical protein